MGRRCPARDENAPPAFRRQISACFHGWVRRSDFFAANGFFLLLGLVLSPAQFLAWGWRIPFLASAVLVGLGLWVRLRLTETPVFTAALAEGLPATRTRRDVAAEFPTADPRRDVCGGGRVRNLLSHHYIHVGVRHDGAGLMTVANF